MNASLVAPRRLVISAILLASPLASAAPPPAAPSPNNAEARLLADVEFQHRLVTALVRADVEHLLRQSRLGLADNPSAVEGELKLMLERVIRAPELSAEARAQLRGSLETALRDANHRAVALDAENQQRQQAMAAMRDRQRIADTLARDQERLKQLMDRFDALMDEGRYASAHEISAAAGSAAADTPVVASAAAVSKATGARVLNVAQRQTRARGVVDTLATAEVALVPRSDDQPMVYPEASLWQELTARRKSSASADLRQRRPAERKIQAALDAETQFDFNETPLHDAVEYLKDLHCIEIQIDVKALQEVGLGVEAPLTGRVRGISLRSALRLLLGEMNVTYIVKHEVLLITSQDRADAEIITTNYPVADLITPLRPVNARIPGMMNPNPSSQGPGMPNMNQAPGSGPAAPINLF